MVGITQCKSALGHKTGYTVIFKRGAIGCHRLHSVKISNAQKQALNCFAIFVDKLQCAIKSPDLCQEKYSKILLKHVHKRIRSLNTHKADNFVKAANFGQVCPNL